LADLVERVRAAAENADSEAVREALDAELRRVGEAYRADPSAWAAWADGFDVVGSAYEQLVSGADRRDAGQFQTPFWAADLMAGWLLQEPVQLLADPGVGSGRLLFRAAERPEPGPERLLGLDLDPVSLSMASVNLTLRSLAHELREANFLLDELPERPDGVSCNPPYSRHHAIPAEQKAAIHEGFEQRLGLKLSRLAALHVLFLVRALEVSADEARLAFITPAEWLDVNYGRKVKQFVLDRAQVEALVILKDDHLFFDGALTTAAITLLRKGEPRGGPTNVIRLDEQLPEVDAVLAALRGEGDLPVEEVELSVDAKWSRPAGASVSGRPLCELARVRRGIATGNNEFFVISEATRREWGIEREQLRPCIRSPRVIEGTELTVADLDELGEDVPRWAIDCHDPEAEQADDALGRYLRHGKAELGADQGYLASQRKLWFGLERRGECPILFTYMNRQQPRFIRNRVGAIPLNTFLIVEPAEGVDADKLCAALNSEHFIGQLQAQRRNYGGGLWKLEPKELGGLRVELAKA
jgi:adenine-specific DNA-methyltransferase